MSERLGYGRVSTAEQSADAQRAELLAAGCARVWIDQGQSSRTKDRPEWLDLLNYARAGDTIVVRRLDRIAGSERLVIETLHEFEARGLHIVSLTEPEIDTTTPMGRALFGIVAVFAQLRVDTIRDNTKRGLEHARAQGRVGGRPRALTPDKITQARRMRDDQKMSYTQIGKLLEVSRATVQRALAD